jgi:hypothetical protein
MELKDPTVWLHVSLNLILDFGKSAPKQSSELASGDATARTKRDQAMTC